MQRILIAVFFMFVVAAGCATTTGRSPNVADHRRFGQCLGEVNTAYRQALESFGNAAEKYKELFVTVPPENAPSTILRAYKLFWSRVVGKWANLIIHRAMAGDCVRKFGGDHGYMITGYYSQFHYSFLPIVDANGRLWFDFVEQTTYRFASGKRTGGVWLSWFGLDPKEKLSAWIRGTRESVPLPYVEVPMIGRQRDSAAGVFWNQYQIPESNGVADGFEVMTVDSGAINGCTLVTIFYPNLHRGKMESAEIDVFIESREGVPSPRAAFEVLQQGVLYRPVNIRGAVQTVRGVECSGPHAVEWPGYFPGSSTEPAKTKPAGDRFAYRCEVRLNGDEAGNPVALYLRLAASPLCPTLRQVRDAITSP